MVQAMDQMKLPPLSRGERTQKRVVEQFISRAEALSAGRDDRIHLGDLGADFRQNFFGSDAARASEGRRFPASRKIAYSQDHKRSSPLRPSRGRRQRFPGFGDALESFDRSSVG